MEKLLQICQIFHCRLDDLLQGDVKENLKEDSCRYDAHKNRYEKRITFAVCFILFGMTVSALLEGLGISEELYGALFLIFVMVSVVVLIVAGMEEEFAWVVYPAGVLLCGIVVLLEQAKGSK